MKRNKGWYLNNVALLFFSCQVYDYLQKAARVIFGPDLVSVSEDTKSDRKVYRPLVKSN